MLYYVKRVKYVIPIFFYDLLCQYILSTIPKSIKITSKTSCFKNEQKLW